jgi:hypothetical protein
MPLKLTKKAPAIVADKTVVNKIKGVVVSEETTQMDTKDVAKQMIGEAFLSPAPQMCEVGLASSYTHNLGDFKSCKTEISLMVPCLPSEVDKVYDYVEKWVEARLQAVISGLVNN